MRQTLRILPTFIFLLLGSFAFAQQPKVTEQQNHLSPVTVKVTFMNDTSRTLLLRGVGVSSGDSFLSHVFGVKTDGGATIRNVWLDSIAAIRGTGSMRTMSSEFTIVLKDGKQFSAQFTGGNCNGEPYPGNPDVLHCMYLYTYNEDDGNQKIDLQKVKSVDFTSPARKDKAGNAMFDTWHYSPYTGEKLP